MKRKDGTGLGCVEGYGLGNLSEGWDGYGLGKLSEGWDW